MSSHVSISVVVIVLVPVVLLLNSHVGLCSCYKRIFSFGDDSMDTGNFVHLIGKNASKYKEAPYGNTFFRHATGRMSDGRVLIDFYAQALKLPLIPPILPEKDSGHFPHGANFAVFGATAREQLFYSGSPWCLGTQMGWFHNMVDRIAPRDAAKKQFLSDSLVVMGGIGGNDYYSYFIAGKPSKDGNIIPDVIAYIEHFIEELICSTGAKAFLIPNNFPIGCFASYLSRFHSDNPEDYDEHGCLRWFNEFSQTHNEQLYSAIGRINITYPDVKLIYADYYNATMEFIKNPGRFGIGNPLVACCGGDGPYHTSMECNGTAKLWGDPHHFANWDGMHMTEKAYNIIVEG
ncbi:hypothetical protein BDA96_08G150100, partial [Sorghum bicolor]